MLIKTIPVGRLAANCYVVADENTLDCAVIDPGDESGAILDYLEEHRLCCRLILLTHGHADHVSAAAALAEETGAAVCMNEKDAHIQLGTGSGYIPPEGTRFCREGDLLQAGGLTFAVLETPGHTPGGLTFRCEDALFTGDTLFSGSCGRTDLPGGSMEAMMSSLAKLAALEGDFEVYPGHMDSTTLQAERRCNYYMRYAQQGEEK
ncbi:MAG: MBL fold metallo-hydrolase [Clostridiales bacterium]|nr:MBL fold metallo-hydrolase [Clostridiales bacterium]